MNPVNTKPYSPPANATWLVTGCSSGLGRALAELIASTPNKRLIATSRNLSSLSYLPDNHPSVLKLEVDVDSSASVDRAFQASAKYFGPDHHIDVVVNNAGYSLSGDSEGVTEQEMHQQLEVNFFGTVRVTLAAIKVMREEKNGRGGLIFNISSLAGVVAFPGHSFYHASKFAVEGWSESVVKELHPDWNIHLCIIEPGPIDTNFEGSSKVHMKPHPAYATSDMPSRQLEAFVKAGLDEGVGAKPLVIAKTLVHVAERNEKVPLHLPLTLAATHLIKMKLEARLKALEDVKELSAIDRDVAQFDVTQL